MVIILKKEELQNLLQDNINAWMHIGGGPNFNAFEFDPNLVDNSVLDSMGYYENRDAWIAGVMVKKIQEYMDTVLTDAVPGSQNS